jgi:predicted NAD/FAD-binding protein
MGRIAIIGTGISGLSAAYLLHPHHDITVYEKDARAGGHSRTVTVRHGDRDIPVDTGFIVFNERNYPNLTGLFRHLGVAVKDSDMTFGLTVDGGRLEWGARDFNAVFGQRRNLLRPGFYKLLLQVMRFNASVSQEAARLPNTTLGELLTRMKLGRDFRRSYLLPMAGAIWSCPPQQMLEFPAQTFVRFFENHGLLSVSGQPQWRTVEGGSQQYVNRLTASFSHRIRTGCGATRVVRRNRGVTVIDAQGGEERYDEIVFGCHADETLAILSDASVEERKALGAIGYQRNVAVLHSDPGFMPKNKRCWASWVYHADNHHEDQPAISLTYWMNSLQGIDERYPLFVTLNPSLEIAPEHVFDTHTFMHPVFDFEALEAQRSLKAMQGIRNTWYCGAYLGHGFHEDGLASAIRVATALGATVPWIEETRTAPSGQVTKLDDRRRRPWEAADQAAQASVG